jgi:tRNA threonylcarbamoyladenosine biosynthesis protein TsaB
MLVLAADTSGKYGSIALARGNPDGSCDLIELLALEGGTFSAQLVPQIASLLSKHDFTKNDLGGFAVASGPGSFTGLRVGLAAIKALGEVLHKPIAAVSLLETIAVSSGHTGRITAALDAGRNQAYVGEYEVSSNHAQLVSERLLGQEELSTLPSQGVLLSPDASLIQAASQGRIEAQLIERPGSDAVARIGWKKILAGDTIAPDALEANYIRRSDAEIFSSK